MSILDKINPFKIDFYRRQARFRVGVYPIVGYILLIIAGIISVTEVIDGNIVGGILGFIVIGGMAKLYFWATRKNRDFLDKTAPPLK